MAATVLRQSRWYTTREAAKDFFFAASAASVTDKDARIDQLIQQASRRIEEYTGRRFIPVTATKEFDYQSLYSLMLGDDIISVTTLKHKNKGTTISSGNYFLYPLNALDDDRPYTEIQLLESSEFFTYTDTRQGDIEVVGKWGYSEITRALSTINEGGQYSASDTTLTVTSGTDYEIGMTLLVETEQLWVTNVATNDLTVVRGINGTTAATHEDGTATSVIEPPDDIVFACNVLVARWLHRGDSAWSDRMGSPQQGFTFSKAIPTEAKMILKQYQRQVFAGL